MLCFETCQQLLVYFHWCCRRICFFETCQQLLVYFHQCCRRVCFFETCQQLLVYFHQCCRRVSTVVSATLIYFLFFSLFLELDLFIVNIYFVCFAKILKSLKSKEWWEKIFLEGDPVETRRQYLKILKRDLTRLVGIF